MIMLSMGTTVPIVVAGVVLGPTSWIGLHLNTIIEIAAESTIDML